MGLLESLTLRLFPLFNTRIDPLFNANIQGHS
jgi:hypothetical protein